MQMIQGDFVPANKTKAKQYLTDTSLRDEDGKKYPFCKNIDVFGKYSIGVKLYIKFLRKLIICLLFMSAIALIPIVSNILGGHYKNTDSASSFDYTTLGNQKGISFNETKK